MGITFRNRWRQGGTLMDAVIAIEQIASVCPRSADVVQFGNFGPIRTFAEYATPAQKARWLPRSARRQHGDEPRHDRSPNAGSAVTELVTTAEPDGRRLCHQRHQGVLHLQPGRRDLSHLCALWTGPRRNRLGDCRARYARLHRRRTVELHERRAMERAAFRELPRPGRERAARTRRLQEADIRLQCRAHRQRRARARARPLRLSTPRAIIARRANNSAGHSANSRACSGNSPRWRSSWKARSSCSIARHAMPTAACPRPTRPRWRRLRATRSASKSPANRCRPWARWATAAKALVEYCMRRCRGWMIAGGSIEILKNRIAEHVFDRRFDQRRPKPKAQAAE